MSDFLPVAVRAWTKRRRNEEPKQPAKPQPRWPRCETALIFDPETTTDAAQLPNFGFYLMARWERKFTQQDIDLLTLKAFRQGTPLPVFDSGVALKHVTEGLFYGNDLPERDPAGFAVLQAYAQATSLELISAAEFIKCVLLPSAARRPYALVCGFNLPFDLSRLALPGEWGKARRGRRKAGTLERPTQADTFALTLISNHITPAGVVIPHPYWPRLHIQHIDNKKSFIRFTAPHKQSEEGGDWRQQRGNFLDLRTLAWALTNRAHSLKSACETFGTEHRKREVEAHGVITPEYIDYARNDVLCTAELLEKLRAEFDRHPIPLQATKAYSPASVAKAYLKAMNITPILKRQPDFPDDVLGYAMTAFYGGRAECRIRKAPLPVVMLDFTSMYPTVNSLMGNWRLLTAKRIELEECAAHAQRWLENLTLEALFRPETWRALPVLVQLQPDGRDILPVRGKYDARDGSAWEIGVNPYDADESHWYTLADAAASVLLSGKVPRVLRAVRLIPRGQQAGMRPVKLGGVVDVDPYRDDLFKAVIEERKRLGSRPDLSDADRARLDLFLKVFANAGSYGVFAEMNREELPEGEREAVSVYGLERYESETGAPEEPGRYCFPPLAAFITGAARLMLAMLERSVTDVGGTYVMADTDSMAVVASEDGGLAACPGGPERLTAGRRKPVAAVRALSWAQVDDIVTHFAALNPYARDAVPGSVLKVEDENFAAGRREQLYCWSISAKRYCLYNLDADGRPVLRKGSEHGLGGIYLSPIGKAAIEPRSATGEPEDTIEPAAPTVKARRWVVEAWQWLLEQALGLDAREPDWLDRIAVSQLTVSKPILLKPFDRAYNPKHQGREVRPFNFILRAHVTRVGGLRDGEQAPMPVAPFEEDSAKWEHMTWYDLRTGEPIKGAADLAHRYEAGLGLKGCRVPLRTFRSVLEAYAHHGEAKSNGPDGRPCGQQTVGLLQRRPVAALTRAHIGKEANRIEDVELGLARPADVTNVYGDERQSAWVALVLPVLREMPARPTAEQVGLTERRFKALRNTHARPRREHRIALTRVAATFAQERLVQAGIDAGEPLPLSIAGLALDDAASLAVLKLYAVEREQRCPAVAECLACGQPFAAVNAQQRYCPACRPSRAARHHRERQRRYRAARARLALALKAPTKELGGGSDLLASLEQRPNIGSLTWGSAQLVLASLALEASCWSWRRPGSEQLALAASNGPGAAGPGGEQLS